MDDGLCDPNPMTFGLDSDIVLLVTVEELVDGLEFPKAKVLVLDDVGEQ